MTVSHVGDVLRQMLEREQKREKFLEAKHKEIKLRKAGATAAAVLLIYLLTFLVMTSSFHRKGH